MRIVNVALVQFESKIMDVSANILKGLKFVQDAARQGADLIVFPELFTTGYNTDFVGKKYRELGEGLEGPTVQTFREAAKVYRINIVLPLVFKKPMSGVVYNSAVVINRNGDVVGEHSKTHLWDEEKKYFSSGDDYPVFELDCGRIGVLICYDAGFPEAARMLALDGVELILSPAAFSIEDRSRWNIYFPSRALENGCFVAGINAVGREGDLNFFGNNKVASPRGELILDANLFVEEMQLVKLDLDEVEASRRAVPYLKDLRRDTYYMKAD
ncbi:nitrilase-related carbon-nitrogen hydrolase [Paenibacillus mendelii]|uniref:Nitrilase-related carbon-nitrogen hydrolase n=1 Tax=Paenibacillus mendelii TaxID=206163 RepID=A0ABV6JB00_9BACL|nr:nitrilase-related carbon-nitrogen hydrolase [Paenibacillus mendelii]MCQ6562957.1 carbon-nitrogen hydrolase [Paenibacillus mendelii]